MENEGEDTYEKIETMRQLAKKRRGDQGPDKDQVIFQELVLFASELSNVELYIIGRAFTHFLAIANAAETHHRIRKIERYWS